MKTPTMRHPLVRALILVFALAAGSPLTGCFPLVATTAVVGSLSAVDRRTLGAQTDDQAIEIKAHSRLDAELKSPGGISVTSYNRRVLLTGQVLDETSRKRAAEVIGRLENVRAVQNELVVTGRASLGTAASDVTISARVKAAYVESKALQSNNIKVVTESGVVYLMGIVTQAEAEVAAGLAAKTSGVLKVVTVWEIVSIDELANIERRNTAEKNTADKK